MNEDHLVRRERDGHGIAIDLELVKRLASLGDDRPSIRLFLTFVLLQRGAVDMRQNSLRHARARLGEAHDYQVME